MSQTYLTDGLMEVGSRNQINEVEIKNTSIVKLIGVAYPSHMPKAEFTLANYNRNK